MMDTFRIAMRHLTLLLCRPLPAQRRRAIERWLRGREEFMRLQRADWVIVSFGNSGRTWLRVMLSRFQQDKHQLDEHELLAFDNLKKRNSEIPAILFSHNNYLRDYSAGKTSVDLFAGKKIVLLVRDPRDTAVSQFFQWRYRMRPNKKFINKYPPHGADISTWDFLLDQHSGVPRIVDYCNEWATAIQDAHDILLVRYEDMRENPKAVLDRILTFFGTRATDEQLCDAVEFASYDNMKKMEESNFFSGAGSRMRRSKQADPQSFKVRKAKVGGYRDHFTDEQCEILAQMTAKLDPVFGYGRNKA
jgi:hypothetical protein